MPEQSKNFSFQNDDKDIVCAPEKKPTNTKLYIHSLVGIAIMVVFQFLPPMGGITPIGMKMVGAFLGMVYLWSLVDTMWPSLLALLSWAFPVLPAKGRRA